jgi:hypothetical protein
MCTQSAVTATVLHFNFDNSNYAVHKFYILVHFVFTEDVQVE